MESELLISRAILLYTFICRNCQLFFFKEAINIISLAKNKKVVFITRLSLSKCQSLPRGQSKSNLSLFLRNKK